MKNKKGYHITKKSNLYSIKRDGLKTRIGRNSNWANEYKKLLCFTDNLYSIFSWKKKLYGKDSFDNYAILSFDLNNIDYVKRRYTTEYIIETDILPENVNVIQISRKNMPQTANSLEDIEKIFEDNMRENAIEIFENNYEVNEQPITDLFIEKPILDNNKKKELVDKLADYEHKKWSEEYDRISWTGKKNSNGSITISEDKIEEILKYNSLDYEGTEDFHKSDIRKAIMETFFIMQENDLIHELGISDKELISILEQTEYDRRNRWNKYMLSLCSMNDGKYIIPTEKAKLWKEEMRTPYNELSEEEKESDRKEVYTIFLEIEKYKSNKQKLTPLQKREEELSKLEEEKQRIQEEEKSFKDKEYGISE